VKRLDPKKIIPVLAVLLILSVIVNVFFLGIYLPENQKQVSGLLDRIQVLDRENNRPDAAVLQQPGSPVLSEGITGRASLQAPAVSQSIRNVIRQGRQFRIVVQNGSIMNISAEIIPGRGRVLVQTTPLMGVVFQDAANTAVSVAGNRSGVDLSNSEVIFSIDSGNKISEVDGPSAGALMTLLMVSAIQKKPIDDSLTLTGTITSDGHIGAIGGIVEKAAAAKENGKTLILLPAENRILTRYVIETENYGMFSLSRQVQYKEDTRDYIEKNIGIRVMYVDTIDDVISDAMIPVPTT
jgi:predicted S18 family serine protease